MNGKGSLTPASLGTNRNELWSLSLFAHCTSMVNGALRQNFALHRLPCFLHGAPSFRHCCLASACSTLPKPRSGARVRYPVTCPTRRRLQFVTLFWSITASVVPETAPGQRSTAS